MTPPSAGQWNVRNTHSTPTRMLWHKVKEFDAVEGMRVAITVCAIAFKFPQPNVVFTEQLGDATPNNLCGRCYNGD
jgi:glyoxylate utilization-related uncharacterized protein